MNDKMASEWEIGFSAGAGLVLVELMFFAIFVAGEAITSASTIALLTIIVSAVCFVQSIVLGSTQSREFLIGFLVGSLLALLIAGQLSKDMAEPVSWGIVADVFGTIVGAVISRL